MLTLVDEHAPGLLHAANAEEDFSELKLGFRVNIDDHLLFLGAGSRDLFRFLLLIYIFGFRFMDG